jgi:PAS domain S-box-containing protein
LALELAQVLEMICQSADGVIAIDANDCIIAWNQQAEQLLGSNAEEVLGRKCYDVLQGIDRYGNPVCFAGCAPMVCFSHGKAVRHFDYQVLTKDGQRSWIDVSFIPLRDEDGKLLAFVHLLRANAGPPNVEEMLRDLVQRLQSVGPSSSSTGPASDDQWTMLTPREQEILRLLCDGTSTAQIAERLCITAKTARNHIERILQKFDAHTRLEAVAKVSDRTFNLDGQTNAWSRTSLSPPPPPDRYGGR